MKANEAGGKPLSHVQAVIAYSRQADLVLEMVENAYKASKRGPKKEWLHGLYKEVTSLQMAAMAFLVPRPNGAGTAAGSARPEFEAHFVLEDRCYEAADLLAMMSEILFPLLKAPGYPGEGHGMMNLALNTGKGLLVAFEAAFREYKGHAEKPGPIGDGAATQLT